MSRDSSDTRARILDCTWNLLESGDKKVRMTDIAKAVGISRQALYLHFPTRAELLIATTRHIDSIKDVDARLADSRAATSGRARLASFISAWGSYIPEIHGLSVALRSMCDNDAEAAAAWDGRMQAVRHGCVAAVGALAADKMLRADLNEDMATDLLWTLLSVENWEHLVRDCGWSQAEYEGQITRLAEAALLVKN
ncbi:MULTISPECIES: TetR/AcrR family transcriptional regulator [unclassified Ruegeria]|uniref:TetR/AcrR family transcriptional regulator n=1 Tax=unclassified Ruegeria TaxID=2625375 RepID=UPI0014883FC2|nr:MULTISPECIES: TetR/AcrR family transcriptional regulator [unclassified Ruegeria]